MVLAPRAFTIYIFQFLRGHQGPRGLKYKKYRSNQHHNQDLSAIVYIYIYCVVGEDRDMLCHLATSAGDNTQTQRIEIQRNTHDQTYSYEIYIYIYVIYENTYSNIYI